MTLTEKFHKTMAGHEDDPVVAGQLADMVLAAPETSESIGLKALIYNLGIGVEEDKALSWNLAEKAAEQGEGIGYFLLGYMVENNENPGSENLVEDDYRAISSAVPYYELCAATDTRWAAQAECRLSDCYTDLVAL